MKKPFYFLLLLSVILELGCENKPTNPQESVQSNWEIGPFIKQDAENPILIPNPELVFLDPVSGEETAFEARNVLNPSAVVKDGKVHLIYRAQDQKMTSRIALATSEDGIHFTKEKEPIFFPKKDDMLVYEAFGG